MKCIKATRPFGNTKTGEIVRVDDLTALQRVNDGGWIYTSKTEWKTGNKPIKKETPLVDETTTEVKTKRPKFKKGKTDKT